MVRTAKPDPTGCRSSQSQAYAKFVTDLVSMYANAIRSGLPG